MRTSNRRQSRLFKSLSSLAAIVLASFLLGACGSLNKTPADTVTELKLAPASVSTQATYSFARAYGADANMVFTKVSSSTAYNRAYWTYWLEINNYQGPYTAIVQRWNGSSWEQVMAVAKNAYRRAAFSDYGTPRTGTFYYRLCIKNSAGGWTRCGSSLSFKFY